jgi:hypothetical protein
LKAGEKVVQTIRVSIVEPPHNREPEPAPPDWVPLPRIGNGPAPTTDFTGLNRNRPQDRGDVAFSINPQSHAFDFRTIIESLEIQPICVETARSFSDGAIHVGPITLDGRDEDPRLLSLFGAAWILGSVAVLSKARATSLSFSPTERFRNERGLAPAHFVLSDLSEFAGGLVRPRLRRHPLSHVILDLELGGRRSTLVSNLTSETMDLDLREPTTGQLRVLDYDGARRVAAKPETWRGVSWCGPALTLPPYAYARIDWDQV